MTSHLYIATAFLVLAVLLDCENSQETTNPTCSCRKKSVSPRQSQRIEPITSYFILSQSGTTCTDNFESSFSALRGICKTLFRILKIFSYQTQILILTSKIDWLDRKNFRNQFYSDVIPDTRNAPLAVAVSYHELVLMYWMLLQNKMLKCMSIGTLKVTANCWY